MTEILIRDLHNLSSEAIKTMTSSRSYQILSERQVLVSVLSFLVWYTVLHYSVHLTMKMAERAASRLGTGRSSPSTEQEPGGCFTSCSSFHTSASHLERSPNTLTTNYRCLPVFQLLELVLDDNVKILDFSKNREWVESEEMNEISRILWKIVGERCRQLEKFIIPKELTYSSTLNSVIGEIPVKQKNIML